MSEYIPDMKEKILADAKASDPHYADRMIVFGPNTDGLPEGLAHYAIRINKLHDYRPINYLVKDNEFFSTTKENEFGRLLQKFGPLESLPFSAAELVSLFVLIGYPLLRRHIVDKIDDLAIPANFPYGERLLLEQRIAPPSKQLNGRNLECKFWVFNSREKILERFILTVSQNYQHHLEIREMSHFY